MHPSLRGYVTAAVGGADAAAGLHVAEELLAVAHLVARNGELAVAITDFGVPVAARRGVLDDLLRPRVDPTTLRIVLHAVQTERADDLHTSLHDVYELARHLSELGVDEVRAESHVLGRSAWRKFATGYAAALFEGIATSEIEQVEEELFRFARIVEAAPGLRTALADPSRPPSVRRQLLDDLLSGKVTPTTLRLTAVLLDGHVRDVAASLDWLVEIAAQARGWRVARVRTARPIGAEEQQSLAEAMARLANNPVELQITDAPDLLGGAVIQIGDLLVDASARHRLEQLEEHLLGTEGTTRGAHS
ncbi:MAG: ATP synthase F1 subunit delta [Acidimicrobiales bacterium]